jgi:hypothetical protein
MIQVIKRAPKTSHNPSHTSKFARLADRLRAFFFQSAAQYAQPKLESMESRTLMSAAVPNYIGAPFDVGTIFTNSGESKVQVASFGDGSYILATTHKSVDSYDVVGRIYQADGTPVTSEFILSSQTTGDQMSPSVSVTSDGGFVAVWTQAIDTNYNAHIYARRFDSSGVAIAPAFQVDTFTSVQQASAVVAADPTGGFVVTWNAYAGALADGMDIFARVYSDTGTPETSQFIVNNNTAEHQRSPTVAVAPDGSFTIAWGLTSATTTEAIFARNFSSTGVPVASQFQVSAVPTYYMADVKVAIQPDGDRVFAFEGGGMDNSYGGVRVGMFTAAGVRIGTEQVVNSYDFGSQGQMGMSMAPDGGFLITWGGEVWTLGSNAGANGILGRTFDQSGAPSSPEFIVSELAPGDSAYSGQPLFNSSSQATVFYTYVHPLGSNQYTTQSVARRLSLASLNDVPEYLPGTAVYHTNPNTPLVLDMYALFEDVSTPDAQLSFSYSVTLASTGTGTVSTYDKAFDGRYLTLTQLPLTTAGRVTYLTVRASDGQGPEAYVSQAQITLVADNAAGPVVVSPPQVLAPLSNWGASGLSVSVAPDGSRLVYWSLMERDSGFTYPDFSIKGQWFDVDGNLSGPVVNLAASDKFRSVNSISVANDHSYVVSGFAKASSQENSTAAVVRLYNASGVAISSLVQLSNSVNTGYASVSRLTTGGFAVQWLGAGTNGFYSAAFNSDGLMTSAGATFTPSNNSSNNIAPLALSDGSYVAIRSTPTGIFGQKFTSFGDAVGGVFTIASGSLTARWSSRESDGSYSVYWSNSSGALVGQKISASGALSGASFTPGFTNQGLGQYALAWEAYTPSGNYVATTVYGNPGTAGAQVFDKSGVALGPVFGPVPIPPVSYSDITSSVIVPGPGNTFRLIWTTAPSSAVESITYAYNLSPVSTTIPNFFSQSTPATLDYDLSAYFTDSDSGFSALSFTIGNNNTEFATTTVVGGHLYVDLAPGVSSTVKLSVIGTDEYGLSASTSFSVTVNKLPVGDAIPDISTDEDAAPTTIDLHTIFSDEETSDANLVYTITGNTNSALVSTSIDSGILTLTQTANAFGSSLITVRATDELGGYTEKSFTLSVAAINDTPTVTPISDVTVSEDTGPTAINLNNAFADLETADASLVYTVTQNTLSSVINTGVSAGILTLTFVNDKSGEGDITIRATDAGGLYVESTFHVTIQPTPDSPVVSASIPPVTVLEGAADLQIDLASYFYDADEPSSGLTYSVVSGPNTHVFTQSITASTLTIDFITAMWGSAKFTIRATDATGRTADTTLSVTATRDPNRVLLPVGASSSANAYTTGNQHMASIAAAPDGSFITFWEGEGTTGGTSSYVRRFAADGTPLSGDISVRSSTTGGSIEGQVAVAPDGSFVVLWTGPGTGDDSGIFFQAFDALGNKVGSEVLVNQTTASDQRQGSVAYLTDGSLIITWLSGPNAAGNNHNVYMRRMQVDGTPVTPELIPGFNYPVDTFPEVAAAPDGGYIVVWETNADSSSGQIVARRYDGATNLMIGSQITVSPSARIGQSRPTALFQPDGSLVIAYVRANSTAVSNTEIYARRYNPSGTAIGSEFIVNTSTTSRQLSPDLAPLPDGGFVISWSNATHNGWSNFPALNASYQLFDASGNKVGSQTAYPLPAGTTIQAAVRPAVLADGSIVLGWTESSTSIASGYEAYFQQLQWVYKPVFTGPISTVDITDGTPVQIDLTTLVTDKDTAPAQLSYSLVSNSDPLGLGAQLVGGILTLSAHYDGLVNIVVRVTDQSGLFSDTTIPVNVQGFNTRPVAAAIPNITVSQNASPAQVDLAKYFTDAQEASASLVYLIIAGGLPTVFTNTITGSLLDIAFINERWGTQILTIRATDSNGAFADSKFTVSATRSPNRGLVPVGPAVIASVSATGGQSMNSIAPAPDGTFIVLWDGNGPAGGSSSYVRRFAADGTPLTGDIQVRSTITSGASEGQVIVAPDNSFVVMWVGDGVGDNSGVYFQAFDAAGSKVGSPVLVNQTTASDQRNSSVAYLADGSLIFSWLSGPNVSGNNHDAYARRFTVSGTPLTNEVLLGTGYQVDTFPEAAGAPDGSYMIVWETLADSSSGLILGKRFDASNVLIGSQMTISPSARIGQSRPSVAFQPDGGFIVAYARANTTSVSNTEIYARRYNAAGTAIGSEFIVNTTTTNRQLSPDVAILPDGGFVISWSTGTHNGWSNWPGTNASFQLYDSAGNKVGGETPYGLPAGTTIQAGSRPAVLSDGSIVVGWNGRIGSDDDAMFQRFQWQYAPVASKAPIIDLDEDTPSVIDLSAYFTDAESPSSSLTFFVAVPLSPTFATLALSGTELTITPALNVSGSGSMVVYIFDPTGLAISQTFTINILPVNDTPTSLTPPAVLAVNGRSPVSYSVNVYYADVETPSSALTYTLIENTGESTAGASITTAGLVTLNPIADGTATITIRATDPQGAFVDNTFTYTVDRNEAPVFTPIQPITLAVGGNFDQIDLSEYFTDSDDAASALTYALVSNGNPFIINAAVTGSILDLNTYLWGFGVSDITIRATDTKGLYTDAHVNVTVTRDPLSVISPAGNQVQANNYATGFQNQGGIAHLADGSFVVVWEGSGTASGHRIWARRFDASGNPLTDSFDVSVNTNTGAQENGSRVVASPTGGFVITWEGFGSGDTYGIFGQAYDAAGAKVGSQFRANTYTTGTQGWNSAIYLNDGSFVVTWTSNTQLSGAAGVYARHFSSTGVAISAETLVSSAATVNTFSQVAQTPDGGYTIIWDSDVATASGQIYAQHYSATDALVGSKITISENAVIGQSRPTIGYEADGDFMVAWSQSSAGSLADLEVVGRLFNADGTPKAGQFQINTLTTARQVNPQIAVMPGNGYVVSWAATNAVEFHPYGAIASYFQVYDNSGAKVGGQIQFSDAANTTMQATSRPAVAPNGDITVAWINIANPSTTGTDAMFRRFTWNAVPVASSIPEVVPIEGDAPILFDLSLYFSDVETSDSKLIYAVTSNTNSQLVTTALDGSYITLSFGENKSGQALITVTAKDEFGFTTSNQITVTVSEGDNDNPVVTPISSFTVNEDAPNKTFNLYDYFSDPETSDASLIYTVVANTVTGIVSTDITSGLLTLAFAKNTFGEGDITIRATDAGGLFAETTFHVTVNSVNDIPIPTSIPSVVFAPGDPATQVDLSKYFTDVEDSVLTYSIVAGANNYVFSQSITGSNLDLAVNASRWGTQVLTIRATDSTGAFVDSKLAVTATRSSSLSFVPVTGDVVVPNNNDYYQGFSSMAAASDGSTIVIWEGQPATSGQRIWGRKVNPAGQPVGSDFLVSSNTSGSVGDSRVIYLPNGSFVVTWYGQGLTDDAGVFFQLFDASANKVGGETRVNNYTTGKQGTPTIAALADGSFVIGWTSTGQVGGASAVALYTRHFAANGDAITAGETLVSQSLTADTFPDITGSPDSGYMIIWDSSAATSAGQIFAQRYTASDTLNGGMITISGSSRIAQSRPTAVFAPDGSFVATWSRATSTAISNTEIYARRFNSSGTAVASEFIVNTSTTNRQLAPQVLMLPDAGFVVSWANSTQSSGFTYWNSYGASFQLFDASGVKVGSEVSFVTAPGMPFVSPQRPAVGPDGSITVGWTKGSTFSDSNTFDAVIRRFEWQAAPTSSAIPQVNVDEDSTPVSLDISSYFSNPNNGGLTYSVVSNSNTGLLGAQITGSILDLSFLANANGASTLTLKATTTGGLSVTTNLLVNVAPTDDPIYWINAGGNFVVDKAGTSSLSLTKYIGDIDAAPPTLSFTIDSFTGGSLFSSSTISGTSLNLTHTGLSGVATFNITATDQAGNKASGVVQVTVVDTTPPTVIGFSNYAASATAAVGSIDIQFSELISLGTFTWADLTLIRDGGVNLITSGAGISITQVSGSTYRVSGLAAFDTGPGAYKLTLLDASVNDPSLNKLSGSASSTWTHQPLVLSVNQPASSITAVTSVTVHLSTPADLAAFTWQDITLTRDGGVNLATSAITIAQSGGNPNDYIITLPSSLTSTIGTYALTVLGAGIATPTGYSDSANASTTWSRLPEVLNMSVFSAPRSTAVTSVGVRLAQPANLASFTWQDISLALDNGINLATSAITITQSPTDPNLYTIAIPASLTTAAGAYKLTVNGAGIQNASGLAFGNSSFTTWTMLPIVTGFTQPTSSITAVTSVKVKLNTTANLATFNWQDLSLTRNAGSNLITSGTGITITQSLSDPLEYTITLPSSLTSTVGAYSLSVIGAGITATSGTVFANTASTTWARLPEVMNLSVFSAPRTPPVLSVGVRLSHPADLATFTWADVRLTLNNGANLITSASGVTIAVSATDPNVYIISLTTALTQAAGDYKLTVVGANITSAAGLKYGNDSFTTWTMVPQVMNLSQFTGTRTVPVTSVAVRLSSLANLATFDWHDITLTRDGGANLATSAITIAQSTWDVKVYVITLPSALTTAPSTYTLTVLGAGITSQEGIAFGNNSFTTWNMA